MLAQCDIEIKVDTFFTDCFDDNIQLSLTYL